MQGLIISLLIVSNIFLVGCTAQPRQNQPAMQPKHKSDQEALTQPNIAPNAIAPTTEIIPAAEQVAENVQPEPSIEPMRKPAKRAAVQTELLKDVASAPANTPATPPTTVPPVEPIATPQPIHKEASNWQPNEVQLIRGNEIITGLQREIGRKPAAKEMQQRLQSHLGLSESQAQQVISSLGLN